MTRLLLLGALALTLMFVATGCERSPTEAYIDMTTCAQMGDQVGFLDGFSAESRPLVEALISMSEAYGMRESNPYRLLVFDSVDQESIRGDEAVITVRTGSRTRRILLIKEEGAWRIDTARLEAFWKEEGRN